MINLEFTGMCEECECADLELECLEFGSFDKTKKEWAVRCKHSDACDAMKDKTIKRVRDKSDRTK